MSTLPLYFKSTATSSSGVNTQWQTQAGEHNLIAAIPPEFKGPGGGFSPEDFYCLAVGNCFVATFKVLAQNSKLEFENIQVSTELVVDKNERNIPEFKKIHFKVELRGPSDADKIKRILEKTTSSCMVANSLKIEKTFELHIV